MNDNSAGARMQRAAHNLKTHHRLHAPKRNFELISERYPQYQIGRGSYGPLRIHEFVGDTTFSMGSWCSVAVGVQVMLGGDHRTDWATTYPFSATEPSLSRIAGHPSSRGDVCIGNDVWIGREAMIMSGVTIGDGAVVGARAVVTRDVAPYAIVGGSPAKVLRYRFDDETIQRLLATQWWDWPYERILATAPLMLDSNIERFLQACEQDL
jgi:chloramphenicol O-acetyltransferase type B